MVTARGLTLIELLMVIALIGVLTTIAFAAINPLAQFERARDAQRKSDLSNIAKALELFYNDRNRYPTTDEYPAILSPGYIQTVPNDPKPPRAYRYEQELSGQGFEVYAALERCTSSTSCFDSQACSNGTGDCSSRASATCGTLACTYGIASSNLAKP